MGGFLTFLSVQRYGILVLLAGLLVACFLLNWLLWMSGLGRYRGISAQSDKRLSMVVADFFTKLIDDFKHLLALVMVLLFAMMLFLAMVPGLQSGKIGEVKDGVQSVAAALGGLIGSIIGY